MEILFLYTTALFFPQSILLIIAFICSSQEKDETDSGYRSGTIPDEKLPRAPSQATLNRQELRRKIESYNHYVPKANLEQVKLR